MYTLAIEKRIKKEKPEALLKVGKIPAVFYGPKEKSTPVSISNVDFVKLWRKAGESSIITLKDGSDEHEALIHDIDLHPVSGAPRHVDFYVIEKGKKLQVNIPLIFEGVSPAVKDLGGILVKVLHEVRIEAMPKDLPHSIIINISNLTELSSTISTKDLVLPNGVELISGKDEVIAAISVAKDEPIEEAPTTIDMSAIEVEKKGKEEKEGEGESEEAKK